MTETTRNGMATPEMLRSFRLRWCLSQGDLARLLDLHKFTISRWEREAQTISQARLLYLALRHLRARFIQREMRRRRTEGARQ